MPSFTYKPLEQLADRPSIRLAVLRHGEHDDPIRIDLKHTTFAEKPKYESLSYTWGSSNTVKAIEINGIFVSVRRNLDRALRHFRRKDRERVLWIDAICINQADDEEKSWQVKLMADIYRRAQRVLVWLGTIDGIEHPRPQSRGISSKLKGRNGRGREDKTQEEKDREDAEYHRVLCLKPYWTRVWIVQEVGAAADLEIHWDIRQKNSKKLIPKSESWDCFFNKIRPASGMSNRATELAKQREGRHGDAFLLANLIEAGADSLCELPHDKIYGFVAIAHDCEDGRFPVDYSKSLWKLYEDVVRFQFASAKDLVAKSIIHFSEVVLKILKDVKAPPEDFWMSPTNPGRCETCFGHVEDGSRLLKITSIYAGNVSVLGPSYDDLTGNPSVRKAWNLALKECDAEAESLRKENDTFISRILALDASELHKAAANICSFGWSPLHNAPSISRFCHPRSVPVEPGFGERSLRLFATTEGTIGLIPSYVKEGDALCRFWKSDVVAVLRTEDDGTWRIVGKCLLAEQKRTSGLNFELVDSNQLGDQHMIFDDALDQAGAADEAEDASGDINIRRIGRDRSPHNTLASSELASGPAKSIDTSGPW
ncbi:heterokaryon incompatibility protein-domain-containing protein [Halenospora varia]|nr:heterokaryon incompatibility protein-domain-containing protein [Halenospora varia]